MQRYQQIALKSTVVIGCIIIIGLIGLYLSRNKIIRHLVEQRLQQVEQAYELQIQYEDIHLNGFNEIVLNDFSIVPKGQDTLLHLQSANIRLRFQTMITKKIEINDIKVDGLYIHFIKKDSTANYDWLFMQRHPKVQQLKHAQKEDYAQKANRLLNLIFGFLPANGELNRVCVTEQKDNNFVTITFPSLQINNNHFHSVIKVREDTLIQYWITHGELNHHTRTLQIEMYPKEGQAISLPSISRRFDAKAGFDTLSCSLTQSNDNRVLSLSGRAKVSGLTIYHKALSPEIINLNQGQLSYQINISGQAIELDSMTTVTFNKLDFHPYVRIEKQEENWHFTSSVNKTWFPADDLFSSLPKGLFSNLKGIKTSGNLAYRFLLDINFASSDSLKFESELKEKDFRILEYGATNLRKMSDEFEYTAYENGLPVRTFPVGPSWEHFTPLNEISPLLQMSVLQSEDGAFYYHRGFLPDAMREALIHDLKVKRFARGGSTISMQLVKNVFLTRNKNFARKLEEALIVWLIETQRLTSKERMYEVYLNIVEWGPMVYGIHEAAAFYFSKRPSQLTTEESIFLASIIPKPKHFRNSFTTDMKLKENLEEYYRLIAGRLAKKGLISESEAAGIQPDIQLTGPAKDIIKAYSSEKEEEENETDDSYE